MAIVWVVKPLGIARCTRKNCKKIFRRKSTTKKGAKCPYCRQ